MAGWPNGKALDYDYKALNPHIGIKRLQVRSLRRSEYCSIDQATIPCCRLSIWPFSSELGIFWYFCQFRSEGVSLLGGQLRC